MATCQLWNQEKLSIQQQINSGFSSVDILDFPWSPTQPPKGSDFFFINSELGNLQCCKFFPSSFSGIQSGHGGRGKKRPKPNVLEGGGEPQIDEFLKFVLEEVYLKTLRLNFFLNFLNENVADMNPEPNLYVLSGSPSTSQLKLISEAPFTIGIFTRRLVTSSDMTWKFDPQKMVGSLVDTGSSRAQWNLVPPTLGTTYAWRKVMSQWAKTGAPLKKTGEKKKVFFVEKVQVTPFASLPTFGYLQLIHHECLTFGVAKFRLWYVCCIWNQLRWHLSKSWWWS